MEPDFESLNKYLKYGFTLYAASADGKFCAWEEGKEWSRENSEIHTAEELRTAIENGITLFRFSPAERGLIVLDLDCHKGKEKQPFGKYELTEGRLTWRNQIEDLKKTNFKEYLALCNDYPFRFQVTSPNGTHLYFKADTVLAKSVLNREIAEGMEIKGGITGKGSLQFINACGSVKNGELYKYVTWQGRGLDFDDCANLPPYLRRMALKTPEPKPKFTPKPTYRQKTYGKRTADDIVDIASKHYSGTSRRLFANNCGLIAGEIDYTADEILTAIKSHPFFSSLSAGKRHRRTDSELLGYIRSGQRDSDANHRRA